MYVFLRDRLVPKSEALVSVYDHGFLYGDGVYETLRVYDGVLFMLEEHLTRLSRSASLIGLTVPLSRDQMKAAIYDTLKANALQRAYVRITVSRGYGPIGLDPDLCAEPTLVIMTEEMRAYPFAFYEQGITTIIAKTRRNLREALDPQIKSLNFLNNILAKIEAKTAGAYEAFMLNASGHLTEGTISNIFFYRDSLLCTPSVECGILDGITRSLVLALATREGLTVREGLFTKGDIYGATEVFITNSTMEVMPVCRIDEKVYRIGEIVKMMRSTYRNEVAAYVRTVKEQGPSLWGYTEG